MDYEGLLELVKNRRSIRRFTPEPVPDEHIDKIIEVARWAPSGFNSQPWEFVVVRKKELRDKIVEFIDDYWNQSAKAEQARETWQKTIVRPYGRADMDYRTAPVFIILFGDARTKVGLPMALRYDPDRCQTIYTSSLANAFLYMHLAAASLGLAAQWVSAIQTPVAHCLTKNLLGIPNEMEVYDMMALGFPAAKPGGKLVRPLEKMVHFDACGEKDFRTDEEVKDFVRKTRTWALTMLTKKANKTD